MFQSSAFQTCNCTHNISTFVFLLISSFRMWLVKQTPNISFQCVVLISLVVSCQVITGKIQLCNTSFLRHIGTCFLQRLFQFPGRCSSHTNSSGYSLFGLIFPVLWYVLILYSLGVFQLNSILSAPPSEDVLPFSRHSFSDLPFLSFLLSQNLFLPLENWNISANPLSSCQ